MGIINVAGYMKLIKLRFNEKESEKVIALRRGEEVLDSKTSISGLYNTEEELHVVVGKHNITTIFAVIEHSFLYSY